MAFHRDPGAMRRFYDGFHPWYGFVEGNTGRSVAAALDLVDPEGRLLASSSVLEHCCGSGSLGLAVAGRCASYEGRDQSEGMLGRARARWAKQFGSAPPPPFSRESVLDFAGAEASVDWVAIAFALHLFPPEAELGILHSFWRAARRGVLVIDHGRRFSPLLSLVEALEGSWYAAYKGVDFGAWASRAGAGLVDREVDGTRVMVFSREEGATAT